MCSEARKAEIRKIIEDNKLADKSFSEILSEHNIQYFERDIKEFAKLDADMLAKKGGDHHETEGAIIKDRSGYIIVVDK